MNRRLLRSPNTRFVDSLSGGPAPVGFDDLPDQHPDFSAPFCYSQGIQTLILRSDSSFAWIKGACQCPPKHLIANGPASISF